MAQSREEILANFQECTGIDNIEEAIMWLDSAHWELLTAINNAIPQDEQMKMYGDSNSGVNNGVPVSISGDFMDIASTSNKDKILEIEVTFQSKSFKYQVPDAMTVRDLKTLIHADTKISPCQQVITGWKSNVIKPSDSTQLRLLNLDDQTQLQVNRAGNSTLNEILGMDVDRDPEGNIENMFPGSGDVIPLPSGSRPRRSRVLKGTSDGDNSDLFVAFRVHDGNQNREHNVKLPRSQTVLDVKKEVVNMTGITLSQQTWLGWPENATDSTKLYELNLEKPCHNLTVVHLEDDSRGPRTRRRTQNVYRRSSSPEASDSGSESVTFENASESFLVEDGLFNEETTVGNRIAPLMPDNVEDETIGSVLFIDGYTSRYGERSPNFFSGPLENAMNEAFLKNGREKKMLAIYLHHDGSILTNVFCSELLGSDSILPLFSAYFVVWGWDVTNHRNREMLSNSILRNLGPTVSSAISAIKQEDYPVLAIVSKLRSNVELMEVIRGNIGASELLNMLVNTVDFFSERVDAEIQSEEERAARDRIKFEQDMAYQESLILDKAKEESRRQQELLKKQEEDRIKREEEERAAEKLAVESRLPAEPADDVPPKEIMTFRFRTPKGDFFIRKFRDTETLQTVFDYLLVQGFRISEYKVISPFPRKDLSALDSSSVLKDIGLCPQETLTLEAR